MGTYSIGEALNLLLERSNWKPKVHQLRLKDEWADIVGRTISKYTRSIDLTGKRLTITTDVGPLKQELQLGKEQLMLRINEHFGERVVEEIVIR